MRTKDHHPKAQQRKLLRLFKAHEQQLREDIGLHARLIDWIAIHGYIQLALRHPDAADNGLRKEAESVLRTIEEICLLKGVFDQELLDYLNRDQSQVESTGAKRKADAILHDAAADLLEACKAQHQALDLLLAMLSREKRGFFPSQSAAWPAVEQGIAAIRKAERKGN